MKYSITLRCVNVPFGQILPVFCTALRRFMLFLSLITTRCAWIYFGETGTGSIPGGSLRGAEKGWVPEEWSCLIWKHQTVWIWYHSVSLRSLNLLWYDHAFLWLFLGGVDEQSCEVINIMFKIWLLNLADFTGQSRWKTNEVSSKIYSPLGSLYNKHNGVTPM